MIGSVMALSRGMPESERLSRPMQIEVAGLRHLLSIGKWEEKPMFYRSILAGMDSQKILFSQIRSLWYASNLTQGKGQFEKPGIKKTRTPLVNICYPMTQTECACFSGGVVYSRQYARLVS